MHRKQKINKGREDTQILTWKPKCGKNHGSPQAAEYTMREGYNDGSTEATTSCTSTSPHGGYNGGNNLFLSLSLCHSHSRSVSIHSFALYTYNYIIVFALSHIYTHMTFGLFTHMASRSSLAHIHVCVPSKRSGGSPPVLRSSGSS